MTTSMDGFGKNLIVARHAEETPLCDFCSAGNPKHAMDCEDFEVYLDGVHVGRTIGAWYACDVCQALVDEGNRVALIQRSLEAFMERYPEVYDDVDLMADYALAAKAYHDDFFRHRKTPATTS